MGSSKPDPQVRKPPSDDEDKVAAFIQGDEEASGDSDSQTSGSPEGQTSGSPDDEPAERKQTTIYLDAEVKKKLKAYCNLEDREMSQFVNDLVADELEDWAPEF